MVGISAIRLADDTSSVGWFHGSTETLHRWTEPGYWRVSDIVHFCVDRGPIVELHASG